MSGLSIGLSTFNSCNKAGSIPHFTQHLKRYPLDYLALTWRGRAYSIIGKTAEAKADFQKACLASYGAQSCLAQAHIENIDGNMEQKVAILKNTTRQYPNCSEAWHDLGSHIYQVEGEVDLPLQYLGRANRLATVNSETGDPWYPWCNQTMGDIYFNKKQQVSDARRHYVTAVQTSKTLTIGHLGLSRCDILNDNLATAKTSFLTAKSLNPVLVQWETFDDFRRQVQTEHAFASLASAFSKMFSDLLTETVQNKAENVHQQQIEEDSSSFQYASGARSRDTSVKSSRSVSAKSCQAQSRRSVSGQGGGSGGRGNGGSSDGSDGRYFHLKN
jgi:tetratricopeptide (TPR) repeat protein